MTNVVRQAATARKKLAKIMKAEFAGDLRMAHAATIMLVERAEQLGDLLTTINKAKYCYKSGESDSCATCDCGRMPR